MRALGPARVVGGDPERHPHPQGGTHPLARALGLDGTAVELDEVADDREAEAQAAERPRARRVGLPEALEEVGEELGRDAPARVANGQLEVGVHALQPDVDAPALGRELDRVGDEVPHHLLQPFRISPDQLDPRIEAGHDPDVLGRGRRPHGLDRRLDRGGEAHRPDVEAQLPADDARDLEEVVDQPGLRPRTALDRLERSCGAGGIEPAAPQLTDPGEDRGERGAELVGHGGEELVLQAAGLLGLPVQPRVLDPEPDPVGDDLEQLRVLSIELPGLERAHVEDADHAALEEDRHAEERAHSLLPQDRVQHLGVVDVRDEDGPLLRRHAPGEATPERDPHTGRDLLLQTLGHPRHQVPAVQQQNGGRVGPEDRAHADEELVQQLIERQPCERGVGDGFEPANDFFGRLGSGPQGFRIFRGTTRREARVSLVDPITAHKALARTSLCSARTSCPSSTRRW